MDFENYCGVIALRGATTAENTKESILERTKELLSEIIKRNDLKHDDVVSMIFSATKDLTKVYPAVAARELGFTKAGLMCMQEMYVEGSLEHCVRVLILVNKKQNSKDVEHVYLHGAAHLRPDLAK